MTGEVSREGLDATMRDFAPGQKLFSRYKLKRTLGRGGMGVVWLAFDEELERDVALKFLPELIVHDRAVLGDLKRETRRSLELTHRNIVRIYDFVHDESSGAISMEFIDGDTLSNLRADRARKVFDPSDIGHWMAQLCDALEYAHCHARIVHRDLKPANLMVNHKGDLKVSDFGIARSLSDSVSMVTKEFNTSGTLLYMSPQQLAGERADPLDDVYSLGATVYELITSKPPFFSGNIDRQVREKQPLSMTERRKEFGLNGGEVDAVWETAVAACLQKDPVKRPQSVGAVAEMLQLAVPSTRGATTAAPKTAVQATTPAARSSRQWVIAAVAGAIVLLVCGVVYAALTFGRQRASQSVKRAEARPLVAEAAAAAPSLAPTPQRTPPPKVTKAPTNDFDGG